MTDSEAIPENRVGVTRRDVIALVGFVIFGAIGWCARSVADPLLSTSVVPVVAVDCPCACRGVREDLGGVV